MSKVLILFLISFAIVWILIILRCVRNEKISVKYSLIWFLMAISLLAVGIFPTFVNILADFLVF